MTETIACPNCQAELVLPGLLAEQTAQCPRCQHTFLPGARRADAVPGANVPRSRGEEDFGDESVEDVTEPPLYQPLTGTRKAVVAMVLMALSVLTCVLQCYINLENYDLFNHEAPGLNLWRFPAEVVNDEQAAEFARRRESIDELTKIASGLSLVNFMTAIAFLTWLHQSAWNLRILSANGFSFTPAQAVWSAFIPLANVIVVYLAIQEIWRASDPGATRTPRSWREVPHSKLIMLAWLAFLGAILVSFYRSANYHSWESEWFLCAAIVNLCMMVTGATLIGVIYQIGQRQRARHAKIYDEAA